MSTDFRLMSFSRAELTTIVMPHMQNVLGDLFGGHLMSLVDQAAAQQRESWAGEREETERDPAKRRLASDDAYDRRSQGETREYADLTDGAPRNGPLFL